MPSQTDHFGTGRAGLQHTLLHYHQLSMQSVIVVPKASCSNGHWHHWALPSVSPRCHLRLPRPPSPCNATKDSSTNDEQEALKAQVRKAVTGTARGKSCTPSQRAAIHQLLQALEQLNPQPDPVSSPLLSGWWALLYQGPLDEERAAVDKSGTLEGPFLAAFQPLTQGIVKTKANTQLLDLKAGQAQNVAGFTILGSLEGSLNIQGTAVPMPSEQGVSLSRRVLVQFRQFVLSLGSWSITVPLDWVKPQGWIETTYLDEGFRIGRGDKGSIFVAVKLRNKDDVEGL